MISPSTKLVCLLGTPLGFSFAPTMQNKAYEAAGVDYFYLPIECDKESLPDIMAAIRRMNFAGFAVTKPLKIEVMQYLDAIDPLAAKIGSINTAVIRDGKITGYQTDGIGFADALQENYGDYSGKSMFIFGAGGASRSSTITCCERGMKTFYITDMFEEASRSLVDDINSLTDSEAILVPHEEAQIIDCIKKCDIVVNASGIGMMPHLGESPIQKEWLSPDQFVCELAYNPQKTKFLEQAEQVGCRYMNGMRMNLIQATHRFRLWTGKEAPFEAMKRTQAELMKQ